MAASNVRPVSVNPGPPPPLHATAQPHSVTAPPPTILATAPPLPHSATAPPPVISATTPPPPRSATAPPPSLIININGGQTATARSATARSQPSTDCDFCFRMICLITLGLSIWILIPHISLIFQHLHAPLPPITTLRSFTTLSNTTSASWNLNLSISNPNPKSSIFYDHFIVRVYYNYHSNNNSDLVFVGEKDFGKFDQTVNDYNSFTLNVSFLIRTLRNKDVFKKFTEDQKKGSVEVSIMASYFMNFKKADEYWRMVNIFCSGVILNFENSSANKTVLGLATDVPKAFQFYNP